MDNEYEDMFVEEDTSRVTPKPQTAAERLIFEAEQEFKGYSAEEKSRQDEEKEIIEEIKNLRRKLHQCKNVKNPRLRHINEERAKKRKEISKEIEKCKLRLQEIEGERKGSNMPKKVNIDTPPPGEKGLILGWNSID